MSTHMFLMRNKKIIMWILPLIWNFTLKLFQASLKLFQAYTNPKGWSCEEA